VETFFDILKAEINEHKFPPGRIFNVDEKGITTVQSSNSKIIATKGKKQVGALPSAKGGKNLTVVFLHECCWVFPTPIIYISKKNYETCADRWYSC
jgi:hypothetical protein